MKSIKVTKLSYDGKQLMTRIPQEVETANELKRENKISWETKEKGHIVLRALYRTDIERIMEKALLEAGVNATFQFPIRCKYGYIADFYIPSKKIIIECDGEKWHKNKTHDRKRDAVLKKKCYIILRFTGKKIKENVSKCIEEIKLKGGLK